MNIGYNSTANKNCDKLENELKCLIPFDSEKQEIAKVQGTRFKYFLPISFVTIILIIAYFVIILKESSSSIFLQDFHKAGNNTGVRWYFYINRNVSSKISFQRGIAGLGRISHDFAVALANHGCNITGGWSIHS